MEGTLRDIIDDGIASNMLQRLVLGHVLRRAANDDAQFEFIVELGATLGRQDVIVRTGDGGGPFVEDHRLERNRQTGLLRMQPVVQADGHELADAGVGHAKARRTTHQRQ